jgi:ATP-dependent RNA helicase RhlE
MPDTVDAYTHRIGRTGRAARTGEAFTFSSPDDVLLVHAIEKVLGQPLERRTLPGFDYQGFDPLGYAPPKPVQPRRAIPSRSRNRGRRDR